MSAKHLRSPRTIVLECLNFGMHVATNKIQKLNLVFFEILIFFDILGCSYLKGRNFREKGTYNEGEADICRLGYTWMAFCFNLKFANNFIFTK